jgi:NADP-dependent 3-hydroxy acid dehydrogenase YdfG
MAFSLPHCSALPASVAALRLGAATSSSGHHGDVRDDTIGQILLQEFGDHQVDVLIGNAVQGAAHEDLGAIGVATLANTFDVNVAGPLRVWQALLPNLLAAPDPVLVNVTSLLGSLSA